MTDKELSIELPTDENGFLPRQCPNCSGKFAIHGDTYQEEHYLNLRCPYCNWIEEFDEFLTEEQLEYAEAVTENEARRMMENEFAEAFEDAFSSSSDFVEVEANPDEIDFGERDAPSPHLSIMTEQIICSECGFKYLIRKEEKEGEYSCPVCRAD
jgi:DNA-directed RNA polymerase subunit RPC12/RpoP